MTLGMMLGLEKPAEEPAPADHNDRADGQAPKLYVVTVLRGGHGIKDASGEKPGESYLVDGDGLTTCNNPAKLGSTVQIDKLILGQAGLCLKQKLNALVTKVEP